MLPFICLPTRVITDPAVTAPALRVFCLLAAHAEQSGWCWPALRTLAGHLGMSRPTIHGHIDHLVKLGHVDKKRLGLPSGVTVTAYYPKMDRPKKAREALLKQDLYRSDRPNKRSGEPNGRSEIDPKSVRTTRTMEVETTKKKVESGSDRPSQRKGRAGPTAPQSFAELTGPGTPWHAAKESLRPQKPTTEKDP